MRHFRQDSFFVSGSRTVVTCGAILLLAFKENALSKWIREATQHPVPGIPGMMRCSLTQNAILKRAIYDSEYAKHWLNDFMKGKYIMAKKPMKPGKGTKKPCG